MNQIPPPSIPEGPPPPPGGLPYPESGAPAWPPTVRPSSTGTAVLGVLNIVFALLCGCANVPWMGVSGIFQRGASLSVDELDEGLKTGEFKTANGSFMLDVSDLKLSDEDRRSVAEALNRGFQASGHHPHLDRVSLFATLAIALQGALLLSGALLLARLKFGRLLGLLAAFALVGVYFLGTQVTAEVADPFLSEVAPVLNDLLPAFKDAQRLNNPGGKEPDFSFLVQFFQDKGAQRLGWFYAAVFSLYPLVVGLVLLFSRGIKAHLSGAPQAYV